ncbi:MAG: cell envelope integrity protein TolA [Opitutaceae bacterium]
MNAHSPQAYFLSAVLHALAAAIVLLLGFAASQSRQETTKVFELVAGQGDNYAATVAPAIGVPGGIKLTVPAPPAPPAPQPPEAAAIPPQSAPIAEAPSIPVAKPVPAKTAPANKDQPSFSKIVKSTENRKAARIEAQYRRQLAKEAAAEAKQRESYEQYLKEHGSAPGKAPRVDAEGIAGGVVGGSTANKEGGAGGKALTRDEQDLLGSYIAMLKARVKENLVPPPGVSDRLEARVEFYLAADGSLSRLRIVNSSGNGEFDEAVLEAFRHTQMPPRPDHRGEMDSLTINMRDEDEGSP